MAVAASAQAGRRTWKPRYFFFTPLALLFSLLSTFLSLSTLCAHRGSCLYDEHQFGLLLSSAAVTDFPPFLFHPLVAHIHTRILQPFAMGNTTSNPIVTELGAKVSEPTEVSIARYSGFVFVRVSRFLSGSRSFSRSGWRQAFPLAESCHVIRCPAQPRSSTRIEPRPASSYRLAFAIAHPLASPAVTRTRATSSATVQARMSLCGCLSRKSRTRIPSTSSSSGAWRPRARCSICLCCLPSIASRHAYAVML